MMMNPLPDFKDSLKKLAENNVQMTQVVFAKKPAEMVFEMLVDEVDKQLYEDFQDEYECILGEHVRMNRLVKFGDWVSETTDNYHYKIISMGMNYDRKNWYVMSFHAKIPLIGDEMFTPEIIDLTNDSDSDDESTLTDDEVYMVPPPFI